MSRALVIFLCVLALPLLACGDDDKNPTGPGGTVTLLDSRDAGAWTAVQLDTMNCSLRDGAFTSNGQNPSTWRSRRIDLTPYGSVRLRCAMTLPTAAHVVFDLFLESNVPGTGDLEILRVQYLPAVADSVIDLSLENALGFREASLRVHIQGGAETTFPWRAVRLTAADLQVIATR